MGVPSYFSYLIRNHKDMLIKLFNFKKEINNLYFDIVLYLFYNISRIILGLKTTLSIIAEIMTQD